LAQLLIKFPYVRGIGISGSLSKNFADENSDIDLFIITKKNRLWIARTLMHLFKKLTFLVNKQHYYCMNYYIDEQQLEIVEKNIYTAIEVVTLIPLQGDGAFASFYSANAWTKDYLPNKVMRISSAKPSKRHLLKSCVEFLCQ
jgi:predicted nucleotidyltransferase